MVKNNKFIKTITAAAFWIFVWEAASLLVPESLSMFLPGPFSVFGTFIKMLPQTTYWKGVGATLIRIFSGLVLGTFTGFVFGILTSTVKVFDLLLSPALKTVRAVPVVSFIILAFLFISVDYLPVFISLLMVSPLIWQAVHDGITGTDRKLCEMAKVYHVKPIKLLFNIKLPAASDRIVSAAVSAVGLAWKSGVAAEVLCTPAISIGKNIYRAKGTLNFNEVYALTLTVVILSLLFEFAVKFFWNKYKKSEVRRDA